MVFPKNLLKFSKHFEKKFHGQKQQFSDNLQDLCPLKVLKNHKEAPVLKSLFIKFPEIKRL